MEKMSCRECNVCGPRKTDEAEAGYAWEYASDAKIDVISWSDQPTRQVSSGSTSKALYNSDNNFSTLLTVPEETTDTEWSFAPVLSFRRVESERKGSQKMRLEAPTGNTHFVEQSDMMLSPDLAKSLGVECCWQVAKSGSYHPRASVARNTKSFVYTLKGQSQKAETQGVLHREPNAEEIYRGVQIEDEYDYATFADMSKLKRSDRGRNMLRSKKISQSQIHQRQGTVPLELEISSSGESSGSSSSDRPQQQKKPQRASTWTVAKPKGWEPSRSSSQKLGNREALTSWGVLCGKIIDSKMLDFTGLIDRAKYGIAKEKVLLKQAEATKGKVLSSVRDRALAVTQRASALAQKVTKEASDKYDQDWNEPDLLTKLFCTESSTTLALFANTARKIFSVQPTLVHADAPCKVFGDIHGQFRDLLLLLRAFGSPDEKDAPMFIFNGDFVDRGHHQLEVIGLLLAFKILLPEKVFLLRGNHEDRSMNKRYGFEQECTERLGAELGDKIFELMSRAFDMLPLAALIGDRILVVHGGIGSGTFTLPELNHYARPLTHENFHDPMLFNLLWSDPVEEDSKKHQHVFGVHESPRGGCSIKFGWNVSKIFCARNGLSLIIRSHQSKKGSPGFDIMHDKLLMRVFSARDYEKQKNDGAVLIITPADDEDDPACQGLLRVRPQVLRSFTRGTEEEGPEERAPGIFGSSAVVH